MRGEERRGERTEREQREESLSSPPRESGEPMLPNTA
jgi:hypothetical protein